MRDVEALVALEPDQARAEDAGERLCGLGLPDSSLAFEQHRLLELEREEERGCEPSIWQIVGAGERRFQLVDRRKRHERSVDGYGLAVPRPSAAGFSGVSPERGNSHASPQRGMA